MNSESRLTVLNSYNVLPRVFEDVNKFMVACGQLPPNLLSRDHEELAQMLGLYLTNGNNMITEEYLELQNAVIDFQKAHKQLTAWKYMHPHRPGGILEESEEKALAAILDALFDLQWVTIAATLVIGVPISTFWKTGAESNLSKINKNTGLVEKRPDGKIMKPEGWKKPDFLKIIREHRERKARHDETRNARTLDASVDSDSTP